MSSFWLFMVLGKAAFWAIILLVPLSIAYYFYLKHRSSYFESINLPHPPITSLFLGNLEEFERDGKSHKKLIEWHNKYGPTYGMMQGGDRVIVTSDLELLQEVFVKRFNIFQAHQLHPSIPTDQKHGKRLNVFTSQGKQWKRLRALFASSLTIQKIKSVDPIIAVASKELVNDLKLHEGKVVDVVTKMMDYTLAVISRSAMGINHKFGENHYLETVLGTLGRQETSKSYIASFLASTSDFLCITKYLEPLGAFTIARYFNELNTKIEDAITQRENETSKAKTKRTPDFMDFLREFQQNDLDTTNSLEMDIKIVKRLSREELKGQAMSFFIGGADTTATLLTYCLYELARHPKYEEMLMQEINDYIKPEDEIDYNSVKDLDFLDRFIKEISRLHPFAHAVINRRALESVTLQDSKGHPLRVDRDVVIQADPFAIAMNTDIWGPNPEKFDPDRFLPENSQNRHPMATLIFGAGLRICPGRNLAIHEAKVTLVHLLQNFKFEFCEETSTVEVTRLLTGFESLKMKVLPRKSFAH